MAPISIHWQPESLVRSSRGSITGFLHVQLAGRPFPDERWSDFVVVVAGWWLQEIQDPVASMEFLFADGPYLIRAQDCGDGTATLDCIESRREDRVALSCRVQVAELRSEIIRTARGVFSECQKRGWSSKDIERLRFA